MQKAAEMWQKNGYRYFTISSESEVYVIKSAPDQKAPVNQYYEMIQSDNFGKNPVGREPNLFILGGKWNLRVTKKVQRLMP